MEVAFRAAGPSPRAWRVVAAQFALGPREPLPLVMAGAVLAGSGTAVHPLERGNVRSLSMIEHDAIRTDPTRMAQGIMTGIGFLGAGVIFKEGLTVRGLTTAASIWVTAAIGILVGIGFWFAAIVGAVAVLVVLALFRFIETRLPSEFYAHHMLRFLRERVMAEDDLRKLIGDHGFTIANLSCRLIEGGQQFEYRMTIKSQDRRNAEKLSVYLRSLPEVVEFRIAPTGD